VRHLSSSLFFLSAMILGCGGGAASSTGTGGSGGAPLTTGSTTTATTASGATSSSSTSATSSSSAATSSSTGTGTTTTTTTTTGATSGTGGSVPNSGDCQTEADCPNGGICAELSPGGFRVCVSPIAPATTCDAPGLDQCCLPDMPCPNNEPCLAGPLVPFCTGVQIQPYNQCAVDQCSKDADCATSQICGLAGALGLRIRACLYAACKLDTDCTAHPGGICAPVKQPCCGATAGLFCIYPSSNGCRTDADCPPIAGHPSRYCAPDSTTGVAACQDGTPICPQ
jgi:hypothetical protein